MMQAGRIVVTGTKGQVARSLLEIGRRRGLDVVAVGRPDFDLTDPRTIEPVIVAARPQVLVSAAAFTEPERAETEPELAESINVRGAEALAECARRLGIPIIQMSTAYVFDGASAAPYRESDPIHPLNVYGRSKAQGEQAVAAAQPAHAILRTSLVHSPFSRNFAAAILRLARQHSEIPIVTDQYINPTAAFDLADGILAVARNFVQGHVRDEHYGVFHMSSVGVTTPAALAVAILQHSVERGGPTARVIPISRADYVSRVERPQNATLDCSRLALAHGVRLPDWRASLAASVDRLLEQRQ